MARVRSDSKIEKWKRDLEAIKSEVLGLHHNRDVYRTVGRIVDELGELPPSLFFDYAQRTYAVTQCAAIRRQAEVAPARVVSLGSLLAEMAAEPERLTREFYVGLHEDPDPYFERLAHTTFDERFAGEVGEHVDPRIVNADLAELHAASGNVKRHVDRHIAHTDRR